MIDKSLYAIIFVYATTFGILAAQFVFADVYGITMRDKDGNELHSAVLTLLDQDAINQHETNLLSGDQQTLFNNPATAAAKAAWEMILIITGFYPFSVAYLLGVPSIVLMGFGVLYIFLVGRTLMGWIRGI